MLIPNTFQYPNYYIDETMFLLTPEENVVLMFAARQILGWEIGRETRRARISLSVFCDGYSVRGQRVNYGTGLSRDTVSNCLDSLVSFGFLKKIGDPNRDGQEFEINFDERKINFTGLMARREERDAANRKRTAAARQVVIAKTPEKPSTEDEIDQSVAQTDSVLSDRPVEGMSDRNIESKERKKVPLAGEIDSLPQEKTADELWNDLHSASDPSVQVTAPLFPTLPDEVYLFEKLNANRRALNRSEYRRFATFEQQEKFRECIQFFNGSTRSKIEYALSNNRAELSAIVNIVHSYIKTHGKKQKQPEPQVAQPSGTAVKNEDGSYYL